MSCVVGGGEGSSGTASVHLLEHKLLHCSQKFRHTLPTGHHRRPLTAVHNTARALSNVKWLSGTVLGIC
jgi:hypothetical protein